MFGLISCWGTCIARVFIEIFYPIHSSIKLLSENKGNSELWLSYWLIYSLLTVFFTFVPFLQFSVISWIKTAFCVWLYHKDYQGALYLYEGFIRKQLETFRPQIQPIYLKAKGVFDGIGLASKPKEVSSERQGDVKQD